MGEENRTYVLLEASMKRITEEERVADMVAASPYRSLLEELNIPLFLAAYTVGEFISAPWGQQMPCATLCPPRFLKESGTIYSSSVKTGY